MWKNDLKQINEKAAEALADPQKYPNLFPDLEWALKVEDMYNQRRGIHVPAISYPTAKGELELNLLEMVKNQSMNDEAAADTIDADADILPTPPQASEEEEEEEPSVTPISPPIVDLEEQRLAAEMAALRIQQEQMIAEATANSLAAEALMEKERLEEERIKAQKEEEEQSAMILAKERELAQLEAECAEAAMAARVEKERLETAAAEKAQMEIAKREQEAIAAKAAAAEAVRAAEAIRAAEAARAAEAEIAAAAAEEEEEEELGNRV